MGLLGKLVVVAGCAPPHMHRPVFVDAREKLSGTTTTHVGA